MKQIGYAFLMVTLASAANAQVLTGAYGFGSFQEKVSDGKYLQTYVWRSGGGRGARPVRYTVWVPKDKEALSGSGALGLNSVTPLASSSVLGGTVSANLQASSSFTDDGSVATLGLSLTDVCAFAPTALGPYNVASSWSNYANLSSRYSYSLSFTTPNPVQVDLNGTGLGAVTIFDTNGDGPNTVPIAGTTRLILDPGAYTFTITKSTLRGLDLFQHTSTTLGSLDESFKLVATFRPSSG